MSPFNLTQNQKIKRSERKVLLILLVFFISSGFMKQSHANTNYTRTTLAGTQIQQVSYCNLQLWKETINTTSRPSDWFPGCSNQTGAESKRMVRELGTGESTTYSQFWRLYLAYEIDWSFLHDNGYGSSYVDSMYNHYYFYWSTYIYKTHFRIPPFEEDDPLVEFRSRSLFYLENYTRLIDDYNNFTDTINEDPLIISQNFSIPEFNGDYYLKYLILNELVIASPINSYLNELIGALGCTNASVQKNTLRLNCRGNSNFIIEVSYNDYGLMETFKVSTAEGILIYRINSWFPATIVLSIYGGIIGGIFVVLCLTIWRWRRRLRFFKEN